MTSQQHVSNRCHWPSPSDASGSKQETPINKPSAIYPSLDFSSSTGLESTSKPTNRSPLCDVIFLVGQREYKNVAYISLETLDAPRATTLLYTTQKSGVRGQGISHHGRNNDRLACPTKCVARRVRHLREQGASPETPSFPTMTMNDNGEKSTANKLRQSSESQQRSYRKYWESDQKKSLVSSLRPGRAKTMLWCARIDTASIQLVGS